MPEKSVKCPISGKEKVMDLKDGECPMSEAQIAEAKKGVCPISGKKTDVAGLCPVDMVRQAEGGPVTECPMRKCPIFKS